MQFTQVLKKRTESNKTLVSTYSATVSSGVQVVVSALGIHFLFMGVSNVTLKL